MEFIQLVPRNLHEFEEKVDLLFKNKSHVSSARVNETTGQLEVDLDWLANRTRDGKDFSIPIKRAKLRDAKVIVERWFSTATRPSHADIQELFDMIDPQNR